MLDVFNIPGQLDNIKIFYAAGTTAWQTWQKPRNCRFIWMMCIGGGSGGGGGLSSSTPVGNAGVGGGGSGGVVKALFPANILPDTLYVQPGPGGIGGTGQSIAVYGASGAGNRSFVSIVASATTAINIVCTSGATAAGSVTTSTGGTAEQIITGTSNAGLLSLGTFSGTAGQAGATNGGVGAVNITPLGSIITSGGGTGGSSGGAGENGGSINSTTVSPIISGGTSSTLNGGSGIVSWKPFFGLGGAGGYGVVASGANGGKGGDGAYGCGGGGGGNGISAGIGGNGGNGGDGLVIIATF